MMKNKIDVKRTDGIEYIIDHLPYSDFKSILDVGCGDCFATFKFNERGKTVTALGMNIEEYGVSVEDLNQKNIAVIEKNFFEHNFEGQKFDAVWAAHIMEHTLNPGLFVEKIKNLLTDNGYAIITVPPFKTNLAGGHMSTGWTLGQLAYFLLISGFDVKEGQFVKYGYNLTAIVKVANFELPKINYDKGDIEILAEYFPPEMNIKQGTEGDLYSINWPHPIEREEAVYRLKVLKSNIKIYIAKTYTQVITIIKNFVGKK